MSYRYVFHADVKKDYIEAYEWYEKQQEGLGKRFLSAIRNKMEQIAITPEAFGERSRKGYREATVDVFPFSIVYVLYKQKQEIFVCAIYHQKRNPEKKYRKTK